MAENKTTWRASCPVCSRGLKVSAFNPMRAGPGFGVERCPEHPEEIPIVTGPELAFVGPGWSEYDRGRQDAIGVVLGVCVGYLRSTGSTLPEIEAQIEAAWSAPEMFGEFRADLDAVMALLAQAVRNRQGG